ncbi:uncharacterized protein LOC134299906 [Anolis carolinensis]|uniref:uncharacterized protein LOC134299906 n=1 Tax=Anolis carolinensis TaxID=28377 RepID=UPI002F2B4997
MPEQQQLRPQLRGKQCNMTDLIQQRISRSKPPVDLGMYRTLYMTDYQPYTEYYQYPPNMELSQKLKLEAQLKEKEFARHVEEPMKYMEEPLCHDVAPPYPVTMCGKVSKVQEAPPGFQHIQVQLNNTAPAESVATHSKERERRDQITHGDAIQDKIPLPTKIKEECGQNWSDYQQFLLESRRSTESQIKGIKRLSLETSVFPKDYIGCTDASTYQRDYKNWPRVRSGFSRANRNFSSPLLEDAFYKNHPWMSDYKDNYSIFLKKLHWAARNPVSSFCSAVKPIPHLSHGMPSQTPIAVNSAP